MKDVEFIEKLNVGDKVIRVSFNPPDIQRKIVATVSKITKTQIIINFKFCTNGVLQIEKYRKLNGTIIKRRLTGLAGCIDSSEWIEKFNN